MKSNELLSYLSDLEQKLSSFSFEELTSDEATRLKKSFQSFKKNLEEKTLPRANNLSQKNALHKQEEVKSNLSANTQEMLITNVSHEIRTPLNGIIGFTELLAEEKLSETQLSYVDAIQSSSNTLLNIINELREYSKLTSGTSYFETIDFNFTSLLKDVCFLCKTLIVNPDVAFNVSISEDIPKILVGDPSKLSQILLNLIGNAIKFVTKGSIDLMINVTALQEDTIVLDFTVKDTGVDKNNLENMFAYDNQAECDTQKNYGGTGLGLSIVKHIIESLNGKINISSELSVGTIFKFSLPYQISQLLEIQATNSLIDDVTTSETLLKNMSILVFEDNILNQKLIQNRLNSWGCNCFITDEVEEGLMVLENKKIDLVLMDLRMPGISGFVVAKIIRNNKNTKINTIPIIALTADLTVQDKNLCTENGINDYILKPFDSKELLQKITFNISHLNTIKSMKTPPVVSKINLADPFDVDLAPVLEECFGDIEMLEELVRLYKQNAVEFIGKTKIDLKGTDIEGLRFNTHKIKSGLKMMQTFGLFRIVEQMHKICLEDHDFKYLNFLFDCFLKEYPIVENAIEKALETLKKSN